MSVDPEGELVQVGGGGCGGGGGGGGCGAGAGGGAGGCGAGGGAGGENDCKGCCAVQ